MFVKCIFLLFVLSFVEADFSYFRSSSSSCQIPRIKNGRARPRQRGTFLRFSCNSRYTLVGNKYATCRYGHWDVPIPVCVKKGCQQLEEVKNAVNMTYHENAWVVFFCLPGHQLTGSPVIYCDGTNWNSTAPECYDSEAKNDETECDFEEPNICGWKPDEYHDFDWRRLNKKTPSSFLQTGPQYDHTYGKNGSGYYMYVESTGKMENETARLISPVYQADLVKNGCFVFWYHMYGRSMGGLVVYQKPDNVPMFQLLLQKKVQNYTLFEQWGDQGNVWYSAVAMLADVGDNFQIVIEGIRGESFMSDIAIDDVSIQHGENCTKAMDQATTPPSVLQESCVGRCETTERHNVTSGFRGCSCSLMCVADQNCCPDFLDVCDYDTREDNSTSNSSVAPPQTQKLIATTTGTTENGTPTTTSMTTLITTKRPIPPSFRKTTTTKTAPAILTTSKPVDQPTTAKTTPTIEKSNTSVTSTTTTTSTTSRPTNTKTRPTTSKKTTPTTSTTVSKPVFTRKTTTLTIEVSPISSSTIFFVRTTVPDSGVKTTDARNAEKGVQDKVVAKKAGGMSGASVAVTVLLVAVALVGGVWILYVTTRSTRGVAALARIRGRTTSDPEVHYLKTDVDDE